MAGLVHILAYTFIVLAQKVTTTCIPFLHNELPAGDDRSAFELTNISLLAQLSLKVVDWASLDYEFRAEREPQLLDEFQLTNHLLVTFGLATGNAPPAPPEE